jgi:hypothetical protein
MPRRPVRFDPSQDYVPAHAINVLVLLARWYLSGFWRGACVLVLVGSLGEVLFRVGLGGVGRILASILDSLALLLQANGILSWGLFKLSG